MPRTLSALAGLALAVVLGGCSSSTTDGNPSTVSLAKTSTGSGDAQSGLAGQALANPLRVVVTDGGTAQEGETVTWGTTSGGSLSPSSSTTDANGVATTTWTLGTAGGAQTATASLSGATGSPVTFTATAPSVPTITVGPGGAALFSPATLSINAGQAVHFVWASGATNHNVSPDTGNSAALPESPGLPVLLDAPQAFDVMFPTAGTFKFFCTAHGNNPSNGTVTGMSGTITVN